MTSFLCPACGHPLDEGSNDDHDNNNNDNNNKESNADHSTSQEDCNSSSNSGQDTHAYLQIFVDQNDDENGTVSYGSNKDNVQKRKKYKALSSSQLAAISQRRIFSVNKWLLLPESQQIIVSKKILPSSPLSQTSKKSRYRNVGRFKAMSMKEWSRSHLGTTRSDRVEKLSSAAMKDQPLRILALHEAGVCVDECGSSDISSSSSIDTLSSSSVSLSTVLTEKNRD